jgi:predicted metalloprotease
MAAFRLAVLLAGLMTVRVTAAIGQLQVSEADFTAARDDAARAIAVLRRIWSGPHDSVAAIVAYTDSQATGCGVLGPDNAFYCLPDDTIYYDAWFAAAVRAMVAVDLESDGDHAVFAILAHEWGHRIYGRLRPGTAGIPVFAELAADCLAGAAMHVLDDRVPVAAEDTAEAALALRLLGDEEDARRSRQPAFASAWRARPAPGDAAAPGRFQGGLSRHGAADERARSFHRGFRHGPGKCMKELERR